MRTLPSADFRKTYARLRRPVFVTVKRGTAPLRIEGVYVPREIEDGAVLESASGIGSTNSRQWRTRSATGS